VTTSRWGRAWLVTCLLGAFVPAAGSAQPLPVPPSPRPEPSAATEPAPAVAPAPDSLYSVMAVVGTGLSFPVREVVCGVGEVVGFFTLAVFRLPVWALTLGDRFGSSEPLDRLGTSIIESACGGSWFFTGQQVKEMAQPSDRAVPDTRVPGGTVTGGERATRSEEP